MKYTKYGKKEKQNIPVMSRYIHTSKISNQADEIS